MYIFAIRTTDAVLSWMGFIGMECGERTRLEQEYFSALAAQQRIGSELKLLLEIGKPELAVVGEQQADAAIEEAYSAWNAFNEHLFSHRCGD
jgi:hypothetical protein